MRNRATTPLKRPKFRMSMSKYNLYNLSRLRVPAYKGRTFFQIKWKAKSVLREYHGEQIREGQWSRMFSRRLRSVVPMDPAYLAHNDGSAESAGRGRGLETVRSRREAKMTPFMNMTFAPLERRLDVAIFRALFASSARQARQFVIHGNVKVNGQVMRYSGYLLNPGDMFQVEPERVMYAMGHKWRTKKKPWQIEAEAGRAGQDAKPDVGETVGETAGVEEGNEEQNTEAAGTNKCLNCSRQGHTVENCPEPRICGLCEENGHLAKDCPKEQTDILKKIQDEAKQILDSPRSDLGGKQKQTLRSFSRTIRSLLSKRTKGAEQTASLADQFEAIKERLALSQQAKDEAQQHPAERQRRRQKSEEESTLFNAMALAHSEGAFDASTWAPRPFLSAFAFIPRYLEVNQNICAAVYLRHPVARPGLAEVPTPYPEETNASAFAWYLRRR